MQKSNLGRCVEEKGNLQTVLTGIEIFVRAPDDHSDQDRDYWKKRVIRVSEWLMQVRTVFSTSDCISVYHHYSFL